QRAAARGAELDGAERLQRAPRILRACAEAAAAEVSDESGRQSRGFIDGAGINAAFEAMAGVGAELVAAGGAPDGDGIPGCGFEDDVTGGCGDLRAGAAHDSGQ